MSVFSCVLCPLACLRGVWVLALGVLVCSYLLRTGESYSGGFEAIGTEKEREPLTLESLQSYDEMCLSALLGVSSFTHFINTGMVVVCVCTCARECV